MSTPKSDPIYNLMECLACAWTVLLTVPYNNGRQMVRAAAGFDHNPTLEDLATMRAEADKIVGAKVEVCKGCHLVSYQAETEQVEFRDIGSPDPIVVDGPTTRTFRVHIDDAELVNEMDKMLVVERSGATSDDVWEWMSKVIAP